MVILLAYLGRFPVKPPSKRDPNSSTSLVFLLLGFPPLLLLATRSSPASNSASTSSWIFSRSLLLREVPPPGQSIQRNVISRETNWRNGFNTSREVGNLFELQSHGFRPCGDIVLRLFERFPRWFECLCWIVAFSAWNSFRWSHHICIGGGKGFGEFCCEGFSVKLEKKFLGFFEYRRVWSFLTRT